MSSRESRRRPFLLLLEINIAFKHCRLIYIFTYVYLDYGCHLQISVPLFAFSPHFRSGLLVLPIVRLLHSVAEGRQPGPDEAGEEAPVIVIITSCRNKYCIQFYFATFQRTSFSDSDWDRRVDWGAVECSHRWTLIRVLGNDNCLNCLGENDE